MPDRSIVAPPCPKCFDIASNMPAMRPNCQLRERYPQATDAVLDRGDRMGWMFICQKVCEKLAQVHAQIGRTPMICKQQLAPAEIKVSR